MEFSKPLLHSADQALLALMILVIMFGMGSSLTITDFKNVLRRPVGVLIGMFSQFGLMPLIAWGLAKTLNLDPFFAVALILIGCLPGGTTSNMFAYFARGSLALSISMTTASTIVAVALMPMILSFYTKGYVKAIAHTYAESAEGFVIPVLNIVSSLVLVLVPVALGMLLRKNSPGWAKAAEDTAGFTGIGVILYLVLTAFFRHGALFLQTPVTVYIAAVGLGLAGFGLGYLLSSVLKQPPLNRRAIALETGIQNGPVAFAVILLSFSGRAQDPMLWLAILYSTFIVISSSMVTLWFRNVGKADWDAYKNCQVHRRLFGEQYETRYPVGFLPLSVQKDPTQGLGL
jgi:bile acid transporter